MSWLRQRQASRMPKSPWWIEKLRRRKFGDAALPDEETSGVSVGATAPGPDNPGADPCDLRACFAEMTPWILFRQCGVWFNEGARNLGNICLELTARAPVFVGLGYLRG